MNHQFQFNTNKAQQQQNNVSQNSYYDCQHMKNLQERINLAVNKSPENCKNMSNSNTSDRSQCLHEKSSRTSYSSRSASPRRDNQILNDNINQQLSSQGDESAQNINIPEIVEAYKELFKIGNPQSGNINMHNYNIQTDGGNSFQYEAFSELDMFEDEPDFREDLQENVQPQSQLGFDAIPTGEMFQKCVNSKNAIPLLPDFINNSEEGMQEIASKNFSDPSQNSELSQKYKCSKNIGHSSSQNNWNEPVGHQSKNDTSNEKLVHSILDILGNDSHLAKMLNQSLLDHNEKEKGTDKTMSFKTYNIDQNEQVTRDKAERNKKGHDYMGQRSVKPKEMEKLSAGDQATDSVGNKLHQLEQKICMAKLENSTFITMNLHDMLKRLWNEIEQAKSDFNGKLNKIYSIDRKEKRLLRNNIVLNYQNIAKLYKQCQSYEVVRQNERAKVDAEFSEIHSCIGNRKSSDKNDSANLTAFIGRHVDFLPVVLMLIMYLVTLILKH